MTLQIKIELKKLLFLYLKRIFLALVSKIICYATRILFIYSKFSQTLWRLLIHFSAVYTVYTSIYQTIFIFIFICYLCSDFFCMFCISYTIYSIFNIHCWRITVQSICGLNSNDRNRKKISCMYFLLNNSNGLTHICLHIYGLYVVSALGFWKIELR